MMFSHLWENNLILLEICLNKLPLKTKGNLQLENSIEVHEAALPSVGRTFLRSYNCFKLENSKFSYFPT